MEQAHTHIRDIDAADLCGVSRATFWRAIAPKLPKLHPSPRTTRFRTSDVLDYLASKVETK